MLEEVDCAGITDKGRQRPTNQDQFLIADLVKTLRINATSVHVNSHMRLRGESQGKLLMVADGMGGHHAGQRASELAIETMNRCLLNTMHWFFRLEVDREEDFEVDLKAALEVCHQALQAEAEAIPEEYGMGTTLTLAYLIWPRIYVVHVGDSRCYIVRDGQVCQLTTDHTYAEQFVQAGVLQPEEAERSRWSHVLWNVVGGSGDKPQPVVYKSELQPGDVVLLCTDGLTRHVSAAEIANVVQAPVSAEHAAQQLVDAANAAGGQDNITVVVAKL